ncbi:MULTISPECIES: DNRLRE domain-containing protein [Streptosporangium]|uniref:DNRLRE domain-containing protein n=1 Tax=Streptosporangium TaxID=2000 RepID=UPI0027D875D6|nr:DNRLRE domain-containing protein [Streptosporangium brasiliense]
MDQVVEAAKKKARTTGKRVEIPSKQTESTTVFANPDGKTLRMEMHAQPIRVKKAKGEGFTPIDTTLVEADGVIKPKTVKGGLTLSAGQDTVLLKSTTKRGTAEIAAPGDLPKPKLKGSTATYRSAYGEGVDLVVTATATGFRQKIVIRERPSGPVTFRLPVDLPKGMSYGTDAAGQPALLAEDGKKIADLPRPLVLDAVANDPNGPIDAGRVGAAPVSVEPDGSALLLAPDAAFLADPAVAYPVTVTAADSDWWEPELGNDTFVNNADYPDGYANSGLDRILAGKSNSGSVRWRSYIRFDEIPADSPLRGGTVDNADLVLWNYLSNDCGLYVGSGITARRVTERWDVSTLTWSNQPLATSAGADTEYGAYSTNCSGSMNYAADLIHSVDDIVQEWAYGEPNYGFQLAAGNESDLTNWRRYRSKEQTDGWGAHGPQLTVDFTPAPKILTYFSESGPRRTSPPTFEEASALHREPYEGVPDRAGVPVEELVTSEGTRTVPYEIGPDKLGPLPGEDWSNPQNEEVDGPDIDDRTPPALVEVGPTRGASDAETTAQVRAVFSEPVWEERITLKDRTGNVVPGTAKLDTERKVLIFTPEQPLLRGTRYTVEVSLAHDAAGNRMAADSWSFTTVLQAAAHWTFDEGSGDVAADSSGNGHQAKVNETTTWTTGKVGGAVTNAPADGLAGVLQQPGTPERSGPLPRAAAAVPTVSGFAVEPSQTVSGSIVTPSLTPALKATVTEAGGVASTVEFRVMKYVDDSLVWSGSAANVASGAQASVTVPSGKLVDGTRYEWQVRATSGGTTSDWSSYQFFTADVPEAVVDQFQVTPSSGTGSSVVSASLTPKLQARVTDPLGGVSTVAFEVARYSDDVVVWSGSAANVASGAQASVTVPSAKLVDGTKYEWRVKATTPGSTPAWSAYQFFTVDAAPRVDQFQVSPSRTASDGAITTSLTPTLLARVIDQLGGPVTASFEVARYSDDVVVWSGSAANVASGTQASVTVPSAKLVDGTKYEWRVRATASGATSAWSSYQFFTADVPEAVTDQFQVTPAETVNAVTVVSSLTPTLLARVTDPLGGTATVDFQVADYLTDTVLWSMSVTGVASGTQTSVTVPSGKLSDKIAYEFRVKATTPGSTPAWSGWQKFQVDVFDPATDPAVGQPQVIPSQSEDGATVTSSVTPELRAAVSHPQASASRVEFEVEHDPSAPQGQGSGQIWATALDNVASGTAAAVTVPADKLADGWLVRWRVRSLAGASSSTWTAWQQVKVAVPKPGVGQFQVTPSQVVDGKTVTTVVTPSLHAQVTYAPGGNLRAEFEVEHDPSAPAGQGTGQIWSGAADGVPAGTQGSVTVPAGKLADGWAVRWRARTVAGTLSSPWSDWQPLLVDQPGSAPAVEKPQVMPSAQVGEQTVTSTVTPQLRVTVLDPRGEPVRAEFEVEHDPSAPAGQGSGQIWTTAVDNVAVGSQAATEVPAGKLSDGWLVRWRARAVSDTASSPWSAWQQLAVEIPKPGVGQFQVTPSQVVDGKTVTTVVTPSLHAQVTYAPGGNLRAEFEVEHDPSAPAGQGSGRIWTTAVDNAAAGTQVTATVPAGKLTDGWVVRWRVRSLTAELASTWSEWQQLTVERPVSAPAVSELRATPSRKVNGKTVTYTVTPELRATLADPRGDNLTAEFEVEHDPAAPAGQGTGQIWATALADLPVGSQATAAVPAGKLTDGWQVRWRARAVSATATGTWSDWQELKVDVVHPGEEPLAQTSGPVIRTDDSFTVAAWLKWDDKDGAYSVIEQKGAQQAPFRLGNDPDHGLVFTLTSADAVDATTEGVLAGVEPPTGEWFHLAGVYDAEAKSATLYLNGTPVKTTPVTGPAWNSAGAVTLGTFMIGDLDEVRIYQNALTAGQVATLADPPASPAASPTKSAAVSGEKKAPTAKVPAAQNTVRAAATESFPYDRHTLEWCEDKREDEDDDDRLADNVWGEARPYSGCTARFHSWLVWTVDTEKTRQTGKTVVFPVPSWMYFRVSVAIHTYAGNETATGVQGGTAGRLPRDIKVWTKLSDVFVTGDDDALVLGTLKLRVRAKAGKATSNCTQIEGPAERVGDVPDLGEEWRTEFVFRSSGALFDSCTIRPWLTLHIPAWPDKSVELWDIPRNPTATNDNAAKVRCDSLTKHVYKGGCVLVGANALYTMYRSDPFMGDVAKHIHDAFYSPHLTAPHFKDANGSPIAKRIPGNYATGGPALTYVSKSTKAPDGSTYRGKNKYRKDIDCREWFPKADSDDDPDPDDVRGELQCDEFPFGSTKEGAGSAGYNYSIRALLAEQNGNAGTDLGIFYARYRFLNGSQFWVNIK